MVDVNLIPKKEAISYLDSMFPEDEEEDEEEEELRPTLIDLIELDLLDAYYQRGHIVYEAKGDPFTAFVKIWSTCSEREIEDMLPEFEKIMEDYEEYLEQVKPRSIGESLMLLLKVAPNVSPMKNKTVLPVIEMLLKYGSDRRLLEGIKEYFALLTGDENNTTAQEITEKRLEIKRLLEQKSGAEVIEERFLDLKRRISNRPASEVKTILLDMRKKLEESG